jgi:hypothetical protein
MAKNLLHHKHANRHPDQAAEDHEAAEIGGPQKLDVFRAGQVDQQCDRDRQTADDHCGSLRLHRYGANLGFHLFTLAQHLRQIAKRFRQVAAGFLLDRHDDAEEIGLGQRHALVQLGAGLAERYPDRLSVDDGANFSLERVLCLAGNDLQAVEQGQAGLDTADDNIDAVRKALEELPLPALLEKFQDPQR